MFAKFVAAGVLSVGLVVPTLSYAQVLTGGYYGASLGQSRYSDACPRSPAAGCNDTDIGFKLFTGVQFGNVFGVEVAAVDLGNIVGAGGAGFSATGLEVVGIAQWPISNTFGVFGKAGGYRMKVAARGVANGNEKTTDWTYGLGLKMNLSRNIGTRLEWQRYKDVGEPGSSGQTDVSFVGASLLYQF